MSVNAPEWLSKAIGASPPAARLTIAALGSERTLGRGGFTISSPAFAQGGELDPSFTACEEDSVAPPLEWSAPPPGAQELVLVAEDADARDGQPPLHWLVWGLRPQKGKLLEGEVPPRTGKNAQGNSEWLLPDPPLGEQHRYVFQLFALDLPLTLMPGATHAELFAEMEGHVMACTMLAAKFEGHEQVDLEWEDDVLDT